ncbi:MAG TPA: ABC transporter permease [Trueperaceae bacterium]|nr:ABC transporter permease [Trueperaceae bacterium]
MTVAQPASKRERVETRVRYRKPGFVLLAPSLFLLVFLVLPSVALVLESFSPGVVHRLAAPAAMEALRLSMVTTTTAMALTIVLGTPLAYLLARYSFRGRRFVDALVDLPLVLPPVIAGVGLLLVFGRRGLIGSQLAELGVTVGFTSVAVVMAQVFVASPFFIRALKVGFMDVPPEFEAAALIDGAGRWGAFWRVSLPLSLPAFSEGLVLAWSRALAEFGATIVFAGSLAGRTRTLPLAIYASLEVGLDAAVAMAALLTVLALGLFVTLRALLRR